jgi:hypothetical protein
MAYQFQIGFIYSFSEYGSDNLICSTAKCISLKDDNYIFESNDVAKILKNNQWRKNCLVIDDNYAKWTCTVKNGWDNNRVKVVGYISKMAKLLYEGKLA